VNYDTKEYCGCVNRSVGSFKGHWDNMESFLFFLFKCHGKNIKILSEHQMEDIRKKYKPVETEDC
jgi:hypothetical protein